MPGGERLVRHPIEEQISKNRLRLIRIGGALASGGLEILDRKTTDEEAQKIENRGFNFNQVQAYLDRLEREDQVADAAMLRGAFNDLLSRIPDLPQTEQADEVEFPS